MVKQFMEAAQEDGEQDRIRIMQADDDTDTRKERAVFINRNLQVRETLRAVYIY